MTPRLKVLDELGDEFERVAREDAASPRRARRRLRRRWALFAIPVALTAGGGALAATQLLKGEPVKNRQGEAFREDFGVGAPKKVAGAVLTSLRVPDPDGGPPWGLRMLTTTRGFGCTQIGRVQDGELGVLGQDGTMGDDGRFHPRPADVVDRTDCRAQDGARNSFIAVSWAGLPASGFARGCTTAATRRGIVSMQKELKQKGGPALPPTCPPQDLRNVRYGLLGPEGRSVTYRGDDGHVHTAAAVGPQGAYLVVLKPDRAHPPRGQWYTGGTPMSGLISVRYSGGRVCRIRNPAQRGGAKACPAYGYVQPRQAKVTAAQVATKVTLTVAQGAVRPPDGHRRTPLPVKVPPQRRLTIAFTARRASDSRSNYTYWLVVRRGMRHGSRCTFSGLGGQVNRDVDRGERVRLPVYVPANCSPTLDLRVRYHVTRADDPEIGMSRDSRRDATVGTASIALKALSP